MARARLHVYTFKEGLLSKLAHDLRLSLGEGEIAVEHGTVEARFVLRSLRVDGVMKKDRLDEQALSDDEKATIAQTMASEVLRLSSHPEARFEGRLGALRSLPPSPARITVEGELTLAGRTRPLDAEVELGRRLRSEVWLRPSDFGVAPYRTMAGALRVQDRVRIALDLPGEGLAVDAPETVDARFSFGREGAK